MGRPWPGQVPANRGPQGWPQQGFNPQSGRVGNPWQAPAGRPMGGPRPAGPYGPPMGGPQPGRHAPGVPMQPVRYGGSMPPGQWPAPQPPKKSNGPAIAGIAVATVAALFVIGSQLNNSGESGTSKVTVTQTRTASVQPSPTRTTEEPTPTETESEPEPSPTETEETETPTGSPTETEEPTTEPPVPPDPGWDKLPKPHSSHPVWVKLQQNRLYKYDVAAVKCPAIPSPVPDGAAYKALVMAIMKCQYAQWSPVFAKMGREFVMPKIYIYNGTVTSPCGKVTNWTVSFYCSNGHHLYMHRKLISESNEWWRLRLAETASHEFFHHVQAMSGILDAAWELEKSGADSDETSRRIELQTACFSSRMLLMTHGWGFTREDYNLMQRWFEGGQDSRHGSAKSNKYWGTRGFYTANVAGCNTWLVHSSWVT